MARLRAWIVLVAALFSICVVTGGVASAQDGDGWTVVPSHAQAESDNGWTLIEATQGIIDEITSLKKQIRINRRETWSLQDLTSTPRTKTAYQERANVDVGYLKWMAKLWISRRAKAWQYAQNPPHKAQWLCIHGHEGDWEDGAWPFVGGLQFNPGFVESYAKDMIRKYGRPKFSHSGANGWLNPWTELEQMWVAERAHRSRGFGPWPNTARYCGLL